jgi:hypothetical protein
MYLVTEAETFLIKLALISPRVPLPKLKKWKSWFVGIEVTVVDFVMMTMTLI